VAAALEAAAAAGAFLLKAALFPGFDAFASNFSGHQWDHVSKALVLERLQAAIGSPNILPVLIGSTLLTIRSFKYGLGLGLLAPLFLLYLVAVRPEHGHFSLYFALPWLLPPLAWLAVFVTRLRSRLAGAPEAFVILATSLALAAPVHTAIGIKGNSWYVTRLALDRPVVDITSMKHFAHSAHQAYATNEGGGTPVTNGCVSMGIAALIPNDLRPDEVADSRSDVGRCKFLLLLNRDMNYVALRARGEALGLEAVAIRGHAELWLARTK
jgi:hypothetical protein